MLPPKPLPAMRTSTRSGIRPRFRFERDRRRAGRWSWEVAALRAFSVEWALVGEGLVGTIGRAGQPHDAVPGGLGGGLLGRERGGAERGERDRRGGLPDDAGR